MAATRKGCDLEAAFRAVFHIDPSIDIATLMEAAIQVVSSTRPKEFSDRMERTLKSVDAIKRIQVEHDQKNQKKSPDEPDQRAATRPPRKLVRRNRSDDANAFKIDEDDGKNKRPKRSVNNLCFAKGDEDEEKKLINLKFENSKRKFQQGIDEIRRKKRKIQVLDVKDLPKAPPMLRNKGRVIRSVH